MTTLSVTRSLLVLCCVASLAACEDPADAAPSAVVEAPPTGTEEEISAPTEEPTEPGLELDTDASSLGFVGSKVTASHEGRFEDFSGSIAMAGDEVQSVSIEIQMSSVVADSERLTNHLKTDDFFDIAQFPTATFTGTGFAPLEGEEGANMTVSGRLNLHGQERAITFPAQIDVEAETVRAQARFSIDRQTFGINYAGMADDLIRDDVVIHFDVRANRS